MTEEQSEFGTIMKQEPGLEPPNPELHRVVPENPLYGVDVIERYDKDTWHAPDIPEGKLKNLAKGRPAPQTKFDYHGRTRAEAYEKLAADLYKALSMNFEVIEVVHGKGEGILRESIRGWLSKCRKVAAFAQPKHNPGCVIVMLRTTD